VFGKQRAFVCPVRKPRKQKEDQVSDNLKEKVVGSDATPVGAKDGTLGAKDSVKRSIAKSGTPPTGAKDSAPVGAKDSAPVGAKDGTLGDKD
jgi:hypothetical protein